MPVESKFLNNEEALTKEVGIMMIIKSYVHALFRSQIIKIGGEKIEDTCS